MGANLSTFKQKDLTKSTDAAADSEPLLGADSDDELQKQSYTNDSTMSRIFCKLRKCWQYISDCLWNVCCCPTQLKQCFLKVWGTEATQTDIELDLYRGPMLDGKRSNRQTMLNEYCLKNHDLEKKCEKLETQLDKKEQNLKESKEELRQIKQRLSQSEESLRTATKEKDEAMTRLSQMVSVKLCDNNPNIVDLNDRYRPTKLAEMFSELYDNEWTDAFSDLEVTHSGPDIIAFLLDIVMISFDFSKLELDGIWLHVDEWFLKKTFPWYQQTRKTLKDGLKVIANDHAKDVNKRFVEYFETICDERTMTVLSGDKIKAYLAKCIQLSLLMNACDPPVIIDCPCWKPLEQRSKTNDHNEEASIDRQLFDREKFKDYTTRGEMVSFYVWPAMYLHTDGPLLSKGVAQGANETVKDIELSWKWWK